MSIVSLYLFKFGVKASLLTKIFFKNTMRWCSPPLSDKACHHTHTYIYIMPYMHTYFLLEILRLVSNILYICILRVIANALSYTYINVGPCVPCDWNTRNTIYLKKLIINLNFSRNWYSMTLTTNFIINLVCYVNSIQRWHLPKMLPLSYTTWLLFTVDTFLNYTRMTNSYIYFKVNHLLLM